MYVLFFFKEKFQKLLEGKDSGIQGLSAWRKPAQIHTEQSTN